MHTDHCKAHTAPSRLHQAICYMHTESCTVHTAPCTLHYSQITIQTSLCTLHHAHCTMNNAQCKVHHQCPMHSALAFFTGLFAQCTLNHAHCTMHTEPCKLHHSNCIMHTVSVLGRKEGYSVKYTLCLKEFPRAKPEGAPEGEGVYLTVYPELSPNMDSISF